ncbi:MAG: hypothetical protein N3D11_08530 [Candidatus Sumerlaeia bacterium]|nr:hypothetical protein [Candidatus Sumerlaeia bacterium]
MRPVLWMMLLAMVAANLAFDLWAAPVARRLADKLEGQSAWRQSIYYPPYHPLIPTLTRINQRVPLARVAKTVMAGRFALTALPLLVVLYFRWTRPDVRNTDLAAGVVVGAFALFAKTFLWQVVWLIADVHTRF